MKKRHENHRVGHDSLVFRRQTRDNSLVRRTISLIALLAVTSGFALIAASPAQAAQFFLRPDRGPAGSTFTLVGAGFLPSEAVRFTWDGQPLAIEEADVNGGVEVKATVPEDAILGGHEVRAEGTSSGLGNSRIFTVTQAKAESTPAAAPAPAPAPAAQAPSKAAPAAAPAAEASTPAAPAAEAEAGAIPQLSPVNLVPVPPDSATAEVAFDVRVPLPGGGTIKEPPEALLLLAFGLLAIMGVRTVSLGRRLHIW
jgi:hypothetical protein